MQSTTNVEVSASAEAIATLGAVALLDPTWPRGETLSAIAVHAERIIQASAVSPSGSRNREKKEGDG